MNLEWDHAKRARNIEKHGVDFADIAGIDWDRALTIEDVRQLYSETRYVTYAPVKGRLCVFAWCYRGPNIRVISLRKANKREERKYDEG